MLDSSKTLFAMQLPSDAIIAQLGDEKRGCHGCVYNETKKQQKITSLGDGMIYVYTAVAELADDRHARNR